MRKIIRRPNPGKAVLVPHVAVVRPEPCIQRRQAGKIVPIDVFVPVLAPRRLIETIECVIERKNAVAQRQPSHVEEYTRLMGAFSAPYGRLCCARCHASANRPAQSHRNMCKRAEQPAVPRKSRPAGQGAEAGYRRAAGAGRKWKAVLPERDPFAKAVPENTKAPALAKQAEGLGCELMIGCMVASSLAMAPALLLTAHARFVDLDGPLLLVRDRPDGLRYEGSIVHPPARELCG
jgi:hypothetical protein